MKKILLLIFCSVVFMSASGAFLWSMLSENDIVLIVPTILMFLCSCVLLFLLFKEIFIGYNEYSFKDSLLLVKRKGKHIASIEKEKIEKIVFICDQVNKNVETITFLFYKKRFFVTLTDKNKDEFLDFFNALPHKTKDNFWYYLISALSHF